MGLLRRSKDTGHDVTDPMAAFGDVVPLAEVVARRRVRTTGQVMRMRARPTSGEPSLAVTLSDGESTITVVWTGRRSIGGVTLGRRLVVEGVCRTVGTSLEMTNPSYWLLP